MLAMVVCLFGAVVDIRFTLRSYLFGALKLTKNPYPDKYFYSGCGVSLDVRGNFLITK